MLLPSEERFLDRLVGAALQNPQISVRLLAHDRQLQEDYAIPLHIWQRLCGIQADTLHDFCRQLYGLPPREV